MIETRKFFAVCVLAAMTSHCSVDRCFAQQPFRVVIGKHIHLTTDLLAPGEAQTLVATFDAAVPQWEEFWKLQPESRLNWRVEAFVMRQPKVFRDQGLIPRRVPEFKFGYAIGNQIWVVAQQSEYYTRHLLLHEGVHSLMFDQFGGAGPSWFMEGTAELLATHSGLGQRVKTIQVPGQKANVPYWGRFKIISARRDENAIPSLESVMRFPRNMQGDVELYGWSWMAAMLLSHYPEYADAFHLAAANGRDDSNRFNSQLFQRLQSDWPVLVARWRMLCRDADYGFEWKREALSISRTDAFWSKETIAVEVVANKGWQSSGMRFPAGAKLSIREMDDV